MNRNKVKLRLKDFVHKHFAYLYHTTLLLDILIIASPPYLVSIFF